MIHVHNMIVKYGLPWLLLSLLGIGSAQAAKLLQVKTNNVVDGQVGLELIFDMPVTNIKDRLEYQANQLIIEIPSSSSELKLNPLPLNVQDVKDFTTEHSGDKLVMKIGLAKLSPYSIFKRGNRIIAQIGSPKRSSEKTVSVVQAPKPKPVADTPVAAPVPTPTPSAATTAVVASTPKPAAPIKAAPVKAAPAQAPKATVKAPRTTINTITAIDFKRTKSGGGQLSVKLDNPSIAADIVRRDHSVNVEFLNTGVLDELIYVMDVNDFATPVSTVEVFKEKSKVRLVVDINGTFDFTYDQTKEVFVLEVKPVIEPEDNEVSYQGKPISLNFQDIPVRTVLQLIADFNNLNLVTTDSVQGNITLRLDDVPWEQALDLVLKVRGLDKRLENNVLLVAPASELAEQERQELENSQQVSELATLYSEYIQINYAKAEDIATLLKSEDTTMLSTRGTVAVDERTNTLLVRDTQESLESINELIDALDVPVKQVVIEARLVTVQEDISDELGINWGFTYGDSDSTFNTSGSLDGIDGWIDGDSSSDDRLNVNLPSSSSSSGTIAFQLANLGDSGILDLELSALEEESKGEVIASPRITTANQHEAYIEQGQEIPYEESTSSGATSISFQDVVVSLTVTPQITPDGRIILDLEVTQDSIGEEVSTGTGTALSLNTKQLKTQVLVNDGETIVLGGIYQQSISESVSKVPFFGDLPYVGALFRTTSNNNEKDELLIFVTPKIVLEAL